MLNLKEIESIVKKQTENPESICHDFGHLLHTAEGAAWFVRVSCGSEHEQKLAWIAGLMHDIVGPTTKKIDHAELSAIKTEKILSQSGFKESDKSEIIRAIRDHGFSRKPKWQSLVHESVFFSDKVFEQSGAMIVFRRGMWLAETQDADWSKGNVHDTKLEHYQKRYDMLKNAIFPQRFRKIFEYQFKWVGDALAAFKAQEAWAINIDTESFNAGTQRTHLEEFIKNYKPVAEEDAKYKEEALAYLDGKLFEKMTNKI